MGSRRSSRFDWAVCRARSPRVRLGVAALALAWATGCETPLWDTASLEARHPALRQHAGQRLADVRPYYWPSEDQLTLLLCRWPDGATIPVAIDPDANETERGKLQRALDAWEGAGLGIRFEPVERFAGVGIEIALVDDMLSWSSSTVAECAVDATARSSGGALDARIVRASIQLGRADPRFVGSALHELGHALGFQGHPRRGDSILVRDAKQLLSTSVRVGKGGEFRDATLSALYALPSGTVLARQRLRPGRTAAIDRLATRASAAGWIGPLLQVGDNAGRVSWLDDRGREQGFRLGGLRGALEDPARLQIEAR